MNISGIWAGQGTYSGHKIFFDRGNTGWYGSPANTFTYVVEDTKVVANGLSFTMEGYVSGKTLYVTKMHGVDVTKKEDVFIKVR